MGEFAGNQFGESVTTVGDVNRDGFADILVAAPSYASSTGKAYVYLGSSNGVATVPSWTAVGEVAADRFGHAISPAGDVNGDGFADVLIGTSAASGARLGRAYVYLGGAGGLSSLPSWTGFGETTSYDFGSSVSTAGDVNADGFADIIIGAPFLNGDTAGRAYAFYGSASGLPAAASWTAIASVDEEDFGKRVSGVGDVNGDGFADIALTADAFTVHVFFGGASGLAGTSAWVGIADFVGNNGERISPAGDVNGDGYADLVLGAANTPTGTASLYLGSSGGLSATASWTASGETSGDSFGWSVSAAGDVNGDGFADLIVGARGHNGSTGKAYVYNGGSRSLSTAAMWTAAGEATSDEFGTTATSAGDVNGDGFADVIVSAPSHGNATGKSYLYLGTGAASRPRLPGQPPVKPCSTPSVLRWLPATSTATGTPTS